MDNQILKNKIKNQLKNFSRRVLTTVILTLTAVFTVWVYAAFVEPTAGPNNSDQDFAQNILGANNDDNDFNPSLVTASSTGSIVERLEYLIKGLFTSECGESTTATQTSCYVDDTARYLTTDLCNETKENQCFVPTDNSYYAFSTECADSTTTAATNCYIDDTSKYVDSGACSAGSNSGYCFMNTATFSAMDADLAAGNIKAGVVILGVTGSFASAESNPLYPDLMRIAAFIEPSTSPADYDQDFTQNILGANNADNDFDSGSVAANRDGSIIERLEYLDSQAIDNNNARLYSTECGESTTAMQTNCYADDTARYITTDLCNEAKENQCFIPTDNSYYAFNTECSDSTTSTQTNCYVDDTARYVDSNICVNNANTGNCYINVDTFTTLDADLVASNIKAGITIFGVAGSIAVCGDGLTTAPEVCDDGGTSWTSGSCAGDCSGTNYWAYPTYNGAYIKNASEAANKYCQNQGFTGLTSVSYTTATNSGGPFAGNPYQQYTQWVYGPTFPTTCATGLITASATGDYPPCYPGTYSYTATTAVCAGYSYTQQEYAIVTCCCGNIYSTGSTAMIKDVWCAD